MRFLSGFIGASCDSLFCDTPGSFVRTSFVQAFLKLFFNLKSIEQIKKNEKNIMNFYYATE